MNEKLKNFLEAVSRDETLTEKIGKEADRKTIIAVARELGFDLCEADFEPVPVELSEDELETVAGGDAVSCSCALGGGGKKDKNDKTCACVAAGWGYSKNGERRCFCAVAGYGYDY